MGHNHQQDADKSELFLHQTPKQETNQGKSNGLAKTDRAPVEASNSLPACDASSTMTRYRREKTLVNHVCSRIATITFCCLFID